MAARKKMISVVLELQRGDTVFPEVFRHLGSYYEVDTADDGLTVHIYDFGQRLVASFFGAKAVYVGDRNEPQEVR